MNRVVNGKLVLKLKEIIDDETEVMSGDEECEVKWQINKLYFCVEKKSSNLQARNVPDKLNI